MPRNPDNPRGPNKVTATNTAAKKRLVLELIEEGKYYTEACRHAEVSVRTFQNWKERDEGFALAVVRADEIAVGRIISWLRSSVMDPEMTNEHEKSLRAFFIVKQKDPSYRDNAKIEHTVSGGLASSLKALAKLGRASEG